MVLHQYRKLNVVGYNDEKFPDSVSRHASVLGFKVESPTFATLFLILRKPSFPIHYNEQPVMKQKWVQNIKITRQQQRRWDSLFWFILHQLHIASWYETKYRYLNSRRVGVSCSTSPLEHACWRCESDLWCIYRWQSRTLLHSYQ